MTRRWLFLFATVAVATASAVRAQVPAFRSAVELVLLNVTVTSGGQQLVTDLSAEDFIIGEEGRPQELRSFRPPAHRCWCRC